MSESEDAIETAAERPKRGRPSAVIAADRDAKGQVLIGLEEITRFIQTLAANPAGITVPRVAKWLERGHIPGGKTGNLWHAWKPALRAHFSGSGETAQAAE